MDVRVTLWVGDDCEKGEVLRDMELRQDLVEYVFLIYQEFQEVIVREPRSSHFRDWFCSFLKSQIYTKSRLIISLLCVSCSMLVNPGEVLILIITSC